MGPGVEKVAKEKKINENGTEPFSDCVCKKLIYLDGAGEISFIIVGRVIMWLIMYLRFK